ncbi:uncharacterized protein [Argopecten irradians]|uniref:uncharacterized protein n=1 Tax=Argopecten irradians TaxID=31199 RepID=UPI00371CF09B
MIGINLGRDYRVNETRQFDIYWDFGEIISVRMFQHNDDGLFLEKIMMSEGERQFTFTCDCWIETDGQPSWILTLTGVHWEVKVYVGDRVNAGSKDTFYLDVNGTTNDKSAIELGYNFMLNEIRMIGIDWNFGDINSIRIYQNDDDGLFLRKVEMSSGNRLYTFQCGCWVQNNTSLIDSQSSWTLTETVFHWIITIYVGGIYRSESVDTFYLDINGTRNDMIGINLGRDYRANETRQFDIYWDFGEIISVRMFQHNDDGLFLEKIMMSEGERQFTFTCDCWIETGGQPSWILTLTGVHLEVKVYVGDRVNAGSKDTFYLDVNGTTNDKSAIELGYDFMLNEIRMIGIDWNFGDINSIRIYQNNDDGLFLRKV